LGSSGLLSPNPSPPEEEREANAAAPTGVRTAVNGRRLSPLSSSGGEGLGERRPFKFSPN
jgi:hypothetical protein